MNNPEYDARFIERQRLQKVLDGLATIPLHLRSVNHDKIVKLHKKEIKYLEWEMRSIASFTQSRFA